MINRLLIIGCVMAMLLLSAGAAQATAYTDDFNSGTQLTWGNQRGDWAADGGVYKAISPGNSPVTASLLPYDVTDFIAEVDINNMQDGGLWARANSDATRGVMLILKSNQIYWHIITDPSSGPWGIYGMQYWSNTTNVHVKVTGVGNILSAYLNGNTSPITTLDLSGFSGYSSGRFGLYSFTSQTFDNVSLTYNAAPGTTSPGDLDGNGTVDIADAILALRIIPGLSLPGGVTIHAENSVSSNRKIGMEDALYIIQHEAGLR